MDGRIASLAENAHLRTLVGTVAVLAVLVQFTEMTLRTVAPITIIFAALVAHDVVDEAYELPEGSNWLVYGGSVVAAGAYLAVTNQPSWVGGLLALGGVWFVFDGVTTIRYGPAMETPAYVADLDAEDRGETMLRMQTLNVVYQALRDAFGPRTGPALAADLDLTESRVESALGYLERTGRVERDGDGYRAKPPKWGRATPVVDFAAWLPRRVGRPFRRTLANA